MQVWEKRHRKKYICSVSETCHGAVVLLQLSLTRHIRACDSPGKSGARMFLSHDKRYFVKTLVSEEVEMMHHILKQYHQVGTQLSRRGLARLVFRHPSGLAVDYSGPC